MLYYISILKSPKLNSIEVLKYSILGNFSFLANAPLITSPRNKSYLAIPYQPKPAFIFLNSIHFNTKMMPVDVLRLQVFE